jgi:hypothetical protein
MKRIIVVALFCLLVTASGQCATTTQPQSLGVVKVSTMTATGTIGLMNLPKAAINALISTATGQMLFCTDCATNGLAGAICISSGGYTTNTNIGQFILSTGTICR